MNTKTPPTNEPELMIEEVELAPLGPGMPTQFRERLAIALKTTDPDVLAAAESTYRGLYASGYDYILEQIAQHLPPFLLWLPSCLNPEQTMLAYERDTIHVWTIALDEHKVMVFEDRRAYPQDREDVRSHLPDGDGGKGQR